MAEKRESGGNTGEISILILSYGERTFASRRNREGSRKSLPSSGEIRTTGPGEKP
jgi:hypothetical protein